MNNELWTNGSIISERYEIMRKIDIGTNAEIRLAYDKVLQRQIFLKLATHDEVLLSASIEHPNILPVHDYGIDNDIVYLVMRSFDMTLAHLLANRHMYPDFDTTVYLKILQAIASSIDTLHFEYNLIHRNIKPHVITMKQGSNWHPYLWDFGVAALAQVTVGTVNYMAPEQFAGITESITYSIDIYAFGIVLFMCLTNQLPFDSENPTIKQKLFPNDDLYSASKYRPDLSVSVDIILQRLCAREPEDRYKLATEAVDDLYRVFYSGQSNIDGKIFISYARKDSEYVHKLASELRRIGLDIWIDQDIEPGSNWDEAIENGLNDCDMMLLIATESSMSSEYVTHEWSYFMGKDKSVYPFIPQEPIPKNIHPRLSRVQHVVGTDDMLNNVARIVDVLAGGTPTKLGDIPKEG